MRDDSIEMRPFRGRPGVPPWSAPASLHEQRLALQAEAAAALIVAAWERIHEADVLTARMPHTDDGELGIEDALAELATVAARLDRTVIQPALRADHPPIPIRTALAS